MAKLKAIGSTVATLRPALGMLQPTERTEAQQRHLFSPWRAWYNTARWRALRLKVLLRDAYQCQRCGRIEPQSSQLVADHRVPHRGDERLFWSEENLQVLCAHCHSSYKQKLEKSGAI